MLKKMITKNGNTLITMAQKIAQRLFKTSPYVSNDKYLQLRIAQSPKNK